MRATAELRRLGVLMLVFAVLVGFGVLPSVLSLSRVGTELWFVLALIAVPLLAALACVHAAERFEGADRKAWHSFALGCLLWIVGTLTWAGYGWLGIERAFPSLADIAYSLTSITFMFGVYHYSLAGSGGSRMQVTNFALAITAVVTTGFVVYSPVLLHPRIGPLGSLVAFSYPVLWVGTFVFCLMCYCLYVEGRRAFPFLLALAASGAAATADVFYGFALLEQAHAVENFYSTLWLASFAFLLWAALEHARSRDTAARPTDPEVPDVRPGEALVPALSVAAILSAGVYHLVDEFGASALLVLPFALGFAAILARREFALFASERAVRVEAEESARRLADVLEHTTDRVMVLDTAWRITFANSNAVDMLFSDRPYRGLSILDVLNARHDDVFYEHCSIAMAQQSPVEFEAYHAPLDVWIEVHAYPTPNDITLFFRDVTEKRRLKEKLIRLSQHDPLTDLANRALFSERLALGLGDDRRNCGLILVMLDLDDFKATNDSLGHMAGDRLLQQFAKRLSSLVRQGDTVARFGGDEFAIIQSGPIEPGGGSDVARRISEALLTPFDIDGVEVRMGASMGIAVAPQHGTRPDELLRHADLALYRAKETKGTSPTYCLYEPAMENDLRALRDRLQLQRTSASHDASHQRPRPQEAAADELALHNANITTALNRMSQGLCMFDADKKLIVCNERYGDMYGIPPEHMRPGTPFRQILQSRLDSGQFAVGDPQDYLRERTDAVEERQPSVKFHHLTDGRTIAITHCPLEDGGWVATHDDVSDVRRIEAKLAHMVHHDELTDLANRILFRDELARALGRGECLALLCLDLDQFKAVNDALGHPLGDCLLRQAADRLRQVTSGCDLVARLGGDSFAILQADGHCLEQARTLAERVIASLNQPYELDGHQVIIGASIGIAGAPTDSGDADELLKRAHTALYRCKLEGRGVFRFFEPEMDARIQTRRGLEVDLRKAFAGEEFEIHYQPIVDIQADRVTGFEALLRWRHATRGDVSPGEFVPLTEDIGMIGQLGAWVLEQACAEAARWPAGVRLAVNLSPAQFMHRDLVVDVLAALKHSGLPADRLDLEITETVMLQNTGATFSTLHSLRDLGVRISLDDFGTGYSSLSFVRRFPFDKLKIDRSFIEDMNDQGGSLGIVRAVLALGDSQGMAITAEGVETVAQLERLRAEGCLEVQGHYFSPARPAGEIADLLTSVAAKCRCERPLASIAPQGRQRDNPGLKLVR